MPYDPPMVEVSVRLAVAVIREPIRRRCAGCQVRRVLYRIEVSAGPGPDRSDARCRRCWGMLE
jgi:hypothetical protein